jgi:hypothetical protein
MVLYSEKNFSPVFGPSSGSTYDCISLYLHGVVLRKDFLTCVWAKFLSRKIECKKDLGGRPQCHTGRNWYRREGLDHDEEASLGDASGDGSSSSSEEDGSDQE